MSWSPELEPIIRLFNLPWWDRLMGTYTAQPAAGHQGMVIGLANIPERRQTLLWMLALPFIGRAGDNPFGPSGRDSQ